MPYRKDQFANNEIYHIILRGIDDNLIFKDMNDYYRGIFSIYEFNNSKPTTIQTRRRLRATFKKQINRFDRGPASINNVLYEDKRDRFIDLLSFCFMPNHIHLLLRQIKDKGITKFMIKVGTGYAGYFNRKYNRKGYVFQNRFKDVRIKDDNQLKIIFTYIHTNPISLIEPNWKDLGIKDSQRVMKFLEENYKWHSYPDFIDRKNFPSVTERDFLLKIMGGIDGCKKAIKNWVNYKQEINKFHDILLD